MNPRTRRWLSGVATALLLGLVIAQAGPTIAQEATPEAVTDTAVPRPVHIHSGTCNELGDVVAPLTDLVQPTGDSVGQRRAVVAATSFTNVPLPLDAILGGDHAINAHLSADEIGTYLACGEIGGVIDATGSLVIGLREQTGSGFTGVAFLVPGADGASTDVSVFLAEDLSGGGGNRGGDDSAETPATGGETNGEDTIEVEGEAATPEA